MTGCVKFWRDGRVGRRRSPAKRVYWETGIEGSNPSLSATYHLIGVTHLNIAVPLQTKLFVLTLFFAGLSGCKQDKQPPPKVEVGSLHSHAAKKESTIVVPMFVAGKWKAVKIAVFDKSNVNQKIYTIPIGGKLAIRESSMIIQVDTFLPAFIMEGSTMTSASNELKNPGVKVQITENGAVIFKGWLFSLFPNTHAFMHPKYGFILVDVVPASR